MASNEYAYARQMARTAKTNLLAAYRDDPNVIGGGFGRRNAHGKMTDQRAAVIYVLKKVPEQFVPISKLLPRRVYFGRDYIEVDVVETGPIYAQAFTARERPAPSGISIGHPNVTAGTLGCLVRDNLGGGLSILSNNHILADQNLAALGDSIIQQASADGGVSPADDIAALTRFITINPAGNIVDAAIAAVNDPADVIDQMKNNLMPVASPDHPAVGLLFAGSCARTFMNPINTVLNVLNIQFLAGGGSTIAAEIGMNVEKVGRTTEYTTSTITEIDVTVDIPYDFGMATFDQQIATAWMSDGGDSGSLVCMGGKGGNENHCDCISTSAAEKALGVDLGLDAALEKDFRDRYLSQTRIGRYAVDLYFLNERRVTSRARAARINDSDDAFARYLYKTYIGDARRAALQPNNPDIVLTENHLNEARGALGRAEQYLSKDEFAAAQQLFELSTQAEGKNMSEILEMLDNKSLYRKVVEIMSSVDSLKQPDIDLPYKRRKKKKNRKQ